MPSKSSSKRGKSPLPPAPESTPSTMPSSRQSKGLALAQTSPYKPPYPRYEYTSEGVRDYNIFKMPRGDWEVAFGLTLVALFVRLFRIFQPTSVVFDEVHFGGFASKYIKGKFFMDVHPPLAKLLITLAGWVAGFDGDFDFKDIGKDYLEPGVPYVAMRLLPALMGVLTVPTVFLTLKASGCKRTTAAFGAALVIFENGLVTQSRLILLDSPLIIFTALTALSWTSFSNQHELGPNNAFSPSWWFWLAATGLCLGATASVKWVGLFTIAWVGSLTALQLLVLLGDTKNVSARRWFKHLFARAFCLIVIPVTFYMAIFAVHFICLVNPGDGDGFMSSEFQATLNSKGMADVPADVIFGSRISLRHANTQGGYLHSHSSMYPTGSKQQQITLYPHKDENNVWLVENQTQPIDWAVDPTGNTSIPGTLAWDAVKPEHVKDGSLIRLYHITTDRRLHSHDERPPVTEADWQFEVSAYGYQGFEGDANDLFRVEIVKSHSDGEAAKQRLRTIQTKFKLVHIMTGCVLFSHKVKLPDWGFDQQEVTCARGGTLPNSLWYVESNVHPMLGSDAEKVNYRNPGFFGKFWELQKVMWTTNAGLVESHAWDSRPPSWPVLRRGINFWGKDNRQIYLTGNPLIWWSSTAAIAIYVAFKAISVLRWQRSCEDYSRSVTWKRFDYEIGTSVLGWAFHYFPFYLMQRQLFLHHYFPALIFAIIALAQIHEFVLNRIRTIGLLTKPAVGTLWMFLFLFASIVVFGLYSPLAYGNVWTKSDCKKVKLFDTWDWDCNTFHDQYADYKLDLSRASGPAPTSQAAHGPAPPVAENPADDLPITPKQQPSQVPVGGSHSEERIEFRDENGNLLDEEQVKALEGKVSFSTRYETRTRLVDEFGNEVFDGVVDQGEPQGQAGTKAEGVDQETKGFVPEGDANTAPPGDVEAEADLQKERLAETSNNADAAEPESDVGKQTARDEL
ncbi:glycosyltransferase family 39 protein [Polychaeton citri CBS 116435]|uniref:Dolichyl-phosphate-mannose--protein mannosyltransferase n=1 Tax=Polychaeton citri CBS 116435 TaxID=1314669 RepID=A0A9P4UU33_9PEZI|nr:glycosyltransferase family 39 protein [Polychaeton citri CBS 116435]